MVTVLCGTSLHSNLILVSYWFLYCGRYKKEIYELVKKRSEDADDIDEVKLFMYLFIFSTSIVLSQVHLCPFILSCFREFVSSIWYL